MHHAVGNAALLTTAWCMHIAPYLAATAAAFLLSLVDLVALSASW